MCGLAGIARRPNETSLEFTKALLEDLMESIGHRGSHATGIAASTKDATMIFKVAEPVKQVLTSPAWKKTMEALTEAVGVIQGHTRFATHFNSKQDDCAHPFREGKVVGAHNGVIYNWRSIEDRLRYKGQIGGYYKVDSQVIFGLLNRFKDPNKALEELDGYFAVTWMKGGLLHMARSPDAQLAGAYIHPIQSLVWNSELDVLHKVLQKAGFKDDGKDYVAWKIMPNVVYSYDPEAFSHETSNVVRNPVQFITKKRFYGQNTARPTNPTFAHGTRWDAETAREIMDAASHSNPLNKRGNRRGGGKKGKGRGSEHGTGTMTLGQVSLIDLQERVIELEDTVKKQAKMIDELFEIMWNEGMLVDSVETNGDGRSDTPGDDDDISDAEWEELSRTTDVSAVLGDAVKSIDTAVKTVQEELDIIASKESDPADEALDEQAESEGMALIQRERDEDRAWQPERSPYKPVDGVCYVCKLHRADKGRLMNTTNGRFIHANCIMSDQQVT